MIAKPFPFFLEDRTGLHTGSDFDDIYDRMFLRVGPYEKMSGMDTTLGIYNVGRRSSSRRDYRPFQREPSVLLHFGPSTLR